MSKNAPGFVVNRVLMPMINEAFMVLLMSLMWSSACARPSVAAGFVATRLSINVPDSSAT